MLAIIPARGGSKGIPRKNIADLAGRPLMDYAIKAALAAAAITRVIVSTEDEEIAHIARACGAEVPFLRPPELATDTMPNGAACLHVIDNLPEPPEVFALIQTTTPFVTPADFDAAVTLFITRQPPAVVSLTPFETPIEAVFQLGPDGELISVLRHVYDSAPLPPATRQSYGERYLSCGAITIVRVAAMRRDPNYYLASPGILGHALPPDHGLDIDTPEDLALARLLMNTQAKKDA